MTTTALTRVQELQDEWTRVIGTLDDTAVRAPSALPGWSRAHLLTHLARNADAVGNLLTWASTGVEQPMYGPGTARDDDINAGATRATAEILADVVASGERLVDLAASLPDSAWTAPVRGRAGQPITGADALTLRLAETTIHLVDLDAGHDFTSACALLGDRIDDVVANMIRMYLGDLPPIRLTDGTHVWTMAEGSTDLVTGTPGAVLAWASGRPSADALDGPVPEFKSLV
ncbi:maleylpyruvate isomerase family mycothiol-dependent enzyme [Amycolatopsis rhabdoformis]|uniref:Maleylpyruvate isomerase family mycothiol-dependent enzyme n=1 Tax=Amycolatopsis rhabdoformis TaxID=1448059 RepID=A0ABZ1I5T7_9PSEU|nr:maleylpyruvate isomerase family mycothiol-dependent enzyme [Amycolatopsis rhabdoformis]WSE29208.1 maleylpyruvate isomerase family mycothiol-dependent enzyme [Amycolatopsis rhabdoformis]